MLHWNTLISRTYRCPTRLGTEDFGYFLLNFFFPVVTMAAEHLAGFGVKDSVDLVRVKRPWQMGVFFPGASDINNRLDAMRIPEHLVVLFGVVPFVPAHILGSVQQLRLALIELLCHQTWRQ
jgi:hypothetical protein